jgi:hypothetical protein
MWVFWTFITSNSKNNVKVLSLVYVKVGRREYRLTDKHFKVYNFLRCLNTAVPFILSLSTATLLHRKPESTGTPVIAIMVRDTIKGHLYVQMGKVCAAKWWPQSLLEETLFSGSLQKELQYDTHRTNPNNHVEQCYRNIQA